MAYQETASAIVTRYDGHVAQLLGDGLLIYFGYPRAHEDDAARALRASLELVEAMGRLNEALMPRHGVTLRIRVGVHTGSVVMGLLGSGDRRENVAVGDTMNIAARLQGLAEPDTVVTSEATRRLVVGQFVTRDLGAHTLKGIAEPVRVHAVLQPSGVRSRLDVAAGRLTRFVGRDMELGTLVDRWERAQDGEGQNVVVLGEAGVGKSRLVYQLHEHLAAVPHTWLECGATPYTEGTPFHPIIALAAKGLAVAPEGTAAEQLGKLEARLGVLASTENVALLADFLGLPPPTPLQMSPELQRRKTIDLLAQWTLSLSAVQPLVVFVEDLHWCDASTLELLGHVIAQSPTARVLLLATTRPEFTPPWPARSNLTTLQLTRLTRRQARDMVAALASTDLPAATVDALVARADGVPLYVEELTKAMMEPGAAHGVEAIPATLADSLMGRLDRLDRLSAAKEVAQRAAVLGREFGYPLLAATAGLDEAALRHGLERLADAEILFARGEPPAATYTFKHALIQETAYQSLLKRTRQQLHARVAQVLEEHYPALGETDPGLFAHHSSAAGLIEVAIPYWHKAANLSLRRMALSEAASQLGRGLELVVSLPASVERDRKELPFHALLGTTYMLSKGWGATEVAGAYGRASELCKSVESAEETVWPLWGVWVFHLVRGEMTRAQEIADRIASVAFASDDRTAQLVAHMILVQVNMYSGRFEEAQRHVALGAGLYLQGEDRSLISLYTLDIMLTLQVHLSHLLWLRGSPDQAAALCEENDAFALSLEHPYSMSWALTWGALPHLYRGDIDRLLVNVAKGIRIAEEFGFAYTAAIGTVARGWGEAHMGDLEAGIERMQAGLGAFRATGSAIVVPFFQTMLAELLGRAGRKAEGLALLDEAMAQVEEWGERWQESEIHRTRGLLLAAMPNADVASAERSLRRAVGVASEQHAPGWTLRATLALARLLDAQGRAEEARSLLVPVLSSFQEGLDTADVRDARAFLRTVA